MSRLLQLVLALFFFFSANAATITWDGGGGDGLWATPANWVGDISPAAGDDVILDNSVVTTSYNVILPSGTTTVSINSIVITPATSRNITLRLPITNTAATGFTATGSGDAVVLNNGAVFFNSAGGTGGNPVLMTATNFFRINNGGRYVHNTTRPHANLVSRLSTAVGTEYGIFEFDVPDISTTISLSGRTYGTLVLSSTSFAAPLTYSGNGASALQIRGDFQINTGVTFSIGMSADIIVSGDYLQAGGSTFNIQNAASNNIVRIRGNVTASGIITKSGAGLPIFELNGLLNQNVSITGSITNSVSFRVNNSSGITLAAPLSLPYAAILQNGKIRTSATTILRMLDNSTVTGGSSTSFVEGPMVKVGDDPSFTFPVGKGNIYAPITLSTSGLVLTDEFQAEYFRSNPQNIYGTNYQSPLDHISYVEYWQLNKTVGTISAPASVVLRISAYSFAHVLATTYVTRYNAGDAQWKDIGMATRTAGAPAPPNITGDIQSSPATQLGIFTLATTDPFVTNPLPLNFLVFEAKGNDKSITSLAWQISEAGNNTAFEVQRSTDGMNFEVVKIMQANGMQRNYQFEDQTNLDKVWYRVKMTDSNGNVTYSKTITVFLHIAGNFIANIYPNPSHGNSNLLLDSDGKSNGYFVITDFAGRTIQTTQLQLHAGRNIIPLETTRLANGIYTIKIIRAAAVTTLRFVKL